MLTNRQHLRRDVTAEVQQRLLSGQLPIGRINESQLAEELGVSRTPLREALLVLEQRGLLASAMGRGFLLLPLNREEASELYPLLGALEPLAVRLGMRGLQAQAGALHALLDAMLAAGDHDTLLARSRQWSALIAAACPNRRLVAMLDDLHRLAARYERAALEHGFPVADAMAKHRAIADAIGKGDAGRAATLVAETCEDCLAALLRWLPSAPRQLPRGLKHRSTT